MSDSIGYTYIRDPIDQSLLLAVVSKSYKWVRSSYSEGDWVQNTKNIHSYDNRNRCTSEEVFNWEGATSRWITSQQTFYTYDTQGNGRSCLESLWNTTENKWELSYKDYNTYTDEGELTSHESYNWRDEEWTGTCMSTTLTETRHWNKPSRGTAKMKPGSPKQGGQKATMRKGISCSGKTLHGISRLICGLEM